MMKTYKPLKRLLDVCADEKRMLVHEGRVVHGQRRQVLARLANERNQFVEQLCALAGPDARPPRYSWFELARELGRTLRGMLGASSESDSISACRRSLHRTEERFDEALELPWPQAMRAALVDQRARLDAARDKLISVQY